MEQLKPPESLCLEESLTDLDRVAAVFLEITESKW